MDFDIGQFLGNLLTFGMIALIGAFVFVGVRRMWLRSRGKTWERTAAAADKDAGDWKIITNADGSKQWAYKGKPLYYFVMDKNPGDKLGEGRGMVWHIAKP